jgi:hypothetical protein
MRTTAYLLLFSCAALVLTLVAGCDPGTEPGGTCEHQSDGVIDVHPLVFSEDWSPSVLAEDPLADHQPAQPICPVSAWGDEFGTLEVSTSACNYLSVEQRLAEGIEIGDELRVQVWWQSLISTEPATGHLALLVDGELLWETQVAIPGASDARSIRFTSPLAAEPGATVTFHLHNHGANTWTLAELARLDGDESSNCE